MAKRPLPTVAQLRQLLSYDPDTGVLTWRRRQGPYWRRWNKMYAGKTAGGPTPDGYIFLKIFGVSYAAHRVIWKMATGRWPKCVDHWNGVRHDNRIGNLRSGSRVMNQRNQGLHRTNTSGRTGVSWNRNYQCWTAQIKMHDVSYNLGRFENFQDAVSARREVEQQHGFTGRQ